MSASCRFSRSIVARRVLSCRSLLVGRSVLAMVMPREAAEPLERKAVAAETEEGRTRARANMPMRPSSVAGDGYAGARSFAHVERCAVATEHRQGRPLRQYGQR